MLILNQIPDTQLPELKGASSATAGSTPVADGLGSAYWSILSISDLDITSSVIPAVSLTVPAVSFSYSSPSAAFIAPAVANTYTTVTDPASSANFYMLGEAVNTLKEIAETNSSNIESLRTEIEALRSLLVNNSLVLES